MAAPEKRTVIPQKETGRVVAFSDSVFAIAMTLLVLDLRVPPFESPPSDERQWNYLLMQWPFLMYWPVC